MITTPIPVLDHGLGGLSRLLTKTEAHCQAHDFEAANLLGFRLFPDMLPFTRQVQLTCDFACRSAARLAGEEPAGFPDTETTLPELQDRIARARDYLSGFGADRFTDAAGRTITLKLRQGERVMTGEGYYTMFALPQFYFHLTTAYNILRHNGVELGKIDYLNA